MANIRRLPAPLSAYFWVFIMGGVYFCARIIKTNRKNWYIFLWVFVSFFLVNLHPNVSSNPRCLVPILPGIAFIISLCIVKIMEKVNFKFILVLICVLLLFSFNNSNFIKIKRKSFDSFHYFTVGKIYAVDDVKIDDIINTINQNKPNSVGIISENLRDPVPIIGDMITYELFNQHFHRKPRVLDVRLVASDKITSSKIVEKSDIILYIKPVFFEPSDFAGYKTKYLLSFQEEFNEKIDKFILLKEVITEYGKVKI